MIKINQLIVGELKTNCYLVIEEITSQCLIIDPGDESGFISEKIIRSNLTPIAILATHGHFDHLLAAWEIKNNFKIPLYAHPKDKKIIRNIIKSAEFWLKKEIVEQVPQVDIFLKKNSKIKLGSEIVNTFPSPGHTPGSVCFFIKKKKVLFSGDTLFKNGLGRTDFAYSSPRSLESSLKKIEKHFQGYQVYPGHGSTFLIQNCKI